MTDFTPIIRKSHKAKHLIIKITTEAEVLVTVPKGVEKHIVTNFIESKNDWIQNKLKKLSIGKREIRIENGAKLILFEEEHNIELIYTKTDKIKIFIDGQKILIFANKFNTPKEIKAALVQNLKRIFKNDIESTITRLQLNKIFKFNRIAVKDNKSNWGSCSTKGNLNFNWRLIFAPKHVYEYVIIHEFCHLEEHNHSSAFWNLVEKHCPAYKVSKNWLKENGHTLYI